MIFPSRSQLESKQITRTERAEAVTKEGLAATLLPARQPDRMGQRHSTASTSSIAPGSAKERVLMLYFNTNVGATLITGVSIKSFRGLRQDIFSDCLQSAMRRRMPGRFACLSNPIHTFWPSWSQPRRRSTLVTSSLTSPSADDAVVFVPRGRRYRFRTMTRHRMVASHRSCPVSL